MTYNIKKIVVIGAGYVGLSNAILLAQPKLDTCVTLYDIDKEKITRLQNFESPLQDTDIVAFLSQKTLNLQAQYHDDNLYQNADIVIIATPTNYDIASGKFDTSTVEMSIDSIRQQNKHVPIIIKSTIPIGFTESMQTRVEGDVDELIMFMPEFLREGQALYDNLYPSRIIIGAVDSLADIALCLTDMYEKASNESHVEKLFMPTTEAEAVKLFANSYLAMRIAFFNELDSFAEKQQLSSQSIIDGMGLDPRIGQHYNNPSFGYGGYCLPKDTQQLKANYNDIPANLIHAVVDANSTRKRFIARQIIEKQPTSVGIYRLSMKKDADNFRDSAVLDIIDILLQHGLTISIYEPSIMDNTFKNCAVIHDVEQFIEQNDLIVANRWDDELAAVSDKVYTRDVFGYS